MIIYLAGPINSVSFDTRRMFESAEDKMRQLGHRPVNPIRLVPGYVHQRAAAMGLAFRDTVEYRRIVGRCLARMTECDGVVMLPSWSVSRGATLERDVALALGMQVYSSPDDVPNAAVAIGGSV